MSRQLKPIPVDAADGGATDFGMLPQLSGYRLRQAQNAVFAHWIASIRARGLPISPGQGGVMILIDRNRRITQSSLARLMGIDASSLVQVIDRLEALGYVCRLRVPEDRRSHALDLTASGEAALHTMSEGIALHEEAVLSQLSPRERVTLTRLLSRVIAGARDTMPGPDRVAAE